MPLSVDEVESEPDLFKAQFEMLRCDLQETQQVAVQQLVQQTQ